MKPKSNYFPGQKQMHAIWYTRAVRYLNNRNNWCKRTCIKTRVGTTVESCSHSSRANCFAFDLRLRLLWLAESASSDCLRNPFLHFTASRFPALRFTALLSGYPLGIPRGLPSRMKCFQDIRVKAFLAICRDSMWNLELCSLLGYPEKFRKLASLLSPALQLNH